MKESELTYLTIGQLSRLFARRQVSPVEVVQGMLERIDRLDKRLKAFITVLGEESIKAARQAEQAILAGQRLGPLHGVPIALKDLFYTQGVRTTGGSKILADFVPNYDSTVAKRLRQAGAIIIGKTNLHEFAMGVSNENPHYGTVRNPWDMERIAGGSSGGSAAAVAAGLASGATGSDTGGSIRIPSALCGIVGLKPTFGRVSKYGVLPLSWSLDHVGPMARCVEDVALFLQAIAGYDSQDPTSSPARVPSYTRTLKQGIKGIRLGLPWEYFFEELDPEVHQAVHQAIETLEGLGAITTPVALPHARYGPMITWTISSAESAAIHKEWLNTQAEDYGADVRNRLEVAQFALATYYIRAQQARRQLREEFRQALREVDIILTPTCPITASRVGERTVLLAGRRVSELTGLGPFTSPINAVGLPALTLPCGFTSGGLPIGIQFLGRPFEEDTVLRAAYAYETSTDWHQRHPPL